MRNKDKHIYNTQCKNNKEENIKKTFIAFKFHYKVVQFSTISHYKGTIIISSKDFIFWN